jgi:transcriptional regulator with XRE-family HTH domain
VGVRIRTARRRAGLSLAQLGTPYYSRAALSAVEHEKVRPSLTLLTHVASRMGISLSGLLGAEPEVQAFVTTERVRAERAAIDEAVAALGPPERAVHDDLRRRGENATGELYAGGIGIFRSLMHPTRHRAAAHLFREAMWKFARAESEDQQRQGDRSRILQEAFTVATAQTLCLRDGAWSGEIDPPLSGYLEESFAYFEWVRNKRPPTHDAMGLRLPEHWPDVTPRALEQALDAWEELRTFFVRVAHGKRTTDDELRDRIEQLTVFLTRVLWPDRGVFEGIERIKALIAEESNARH